MQHLLFARSSLSDADENPGHPQREQVSLIRSHTLPDQPAAPVSVAPNEKGRNTSTVFKCNDGFYTPNSKRLERAWSRGIVDRTKEYSFVLSTMPRLHARSSLLE